MKNRTAVKLTCYFGAAILVFAMVAGLIFINLFERHTIDFHHTDLETRVKDVAQTLSKYEDATNNIEETGGHHNKREGKHESIGNTYSAYLQYINDMTLGDVWVVDRETEEITCGHGHAQVNYQDLPEGAEDLIQQVYQGQTAFSENFSSMMPEQMLTVGTPITDSSGEITGAVLLHSPVKGVANSVKEGARMLLLSLIVALLIVGIMAVVMSLKFTRPLNKMKDAAVLLSKGDYEVRTKVRQNDEIGELAETIDMLAGQLSLSAKEREHLEQMRRDFISNVSHELRTPVTAIRGSVEALCDGVITDETQIQEYHNQILAETIQLQRLVNDLLELSRLQNPNFTIEKEPFNLNEAVHDAIRSARRTATDKQIEITIDEDTPQYEFNGDYGRIRQMLLIILDNAIKFSSPGGRIEVTFLTNPEFFLTIRDYGRGITPEELPYIFDRFHKTRDPGNKKGTGLGLPIAKEIALRHHLTLTAESTPGSHTEFQFRFIPGSQSEE